MVDWKSYVIIVLFLIAFGGILYLISTFLLKKFKDMGLKKHTISLWIWRTSITVVIIYVFTVLWINRLPLSIVTSGPLSFLSITSILTFFVALLEIAIIDILLPNVIKLWKRILIETILFVVLVAVTIAIFGIYQLFSLT